MSKYQYSSRMTALEILIAVSYSFVVQLLIISPFLIMVFFASEASAFDAGTKSIMKVYDGDSINVRLRLAHVDTPEIKGKCQAEIGLAEKARAYTQAFMSDFHNFEIETVGVGRYGRPLVEVRADGRYLNQELVDSGFARIYEGKRKSWCQ